MSSHPYDRADVLSKFHFLDKTQKLGIQKLLREYGYRASIRIVARTARDLRRLLEIERSRRKEGVWYYDINHHINIAHALEKEQTFGKNLVRLVIAERAREAFKGEKAA